MELPAGTTGASLSAAIRGTVLANGLSSGIVKVFAYYPVPGYSCLPTDPRVDLAVFCAGPFASPGGKASESHAVKACVSTYRKIHPESVPVHAKSAGNYINSFLALSEAKRRGCDEAILLDTQGFVAEGGTSNIFMVKNGEVLTPTLRSILPGITRKFILDIAGNLAPCREGDFTAADLAGADESFFSNSVERVMPVRSIEGLSVGEECPGPVTRRIIDEIASVIAGRNPAFSRWLTPVA